MPKLGLEPSPMRNQWRTEVHLLQTGSRVMYHTFNMWFYLFVFSDQQIYPSSYQSTNRLRLNTYLFTNSVISTGKHFLGYLVHRDITDNAFRWLLPLLVQSGFWTTGHYEGSVFVCAEPGIWSSCLLKSKCRDTWWKAGRLLHTTGSTKTNH